MKDFIQEYHHRRPKIVRSLDHGKHRPRHLVRALGWASLKDGLINVLTYGRYEGEYTEIALDNLITHSIELVQEERLEKLENPSDLWEKIMIERWVC